MNQDTNEQNHGFHMLGMLFLLLSWIVLIFVHESAQEKADEASKNRSSLGFQSELRKILAGQRNAERMLARLETLMPTADSKRIGVPNVSSMQKRHTWILVMDRDFDDLLERAFSANTIAKKLADTNATRTKVSSSYLEIQSLHNEFQGALEPYLSSFRKLVGSRGPLQNTSADSLRLLKESQDNMVVSLNRLLPRWNEYDLALSAELTALDDELSKEQGRLVVAATNWKRVSYFFSFLGSAVPIAVLLRVWKLQRRKNNQLHNSASTRV